MSLRDLAVDWLGANCLLEKARTDILGALDGELEQGFGCRFVIGRNLTNSGKPYLVHCHRGELFTFELTPSQAARFQVTDDRIFVGKSSYPAIGRPRSDINVWLDEVIVDNAAALDRSSPITGRATYRTAKDFPQRTPIRVETAPGRTFFDHVNGLAAPGQTIRFSLNAFGNTVDDSGQPFAGPTVLLFQIGTEDRADRRSAEAIDPPDPSRPAVRGSPLSDIRAVLVEIV